MAARGVFDFDSFGGAASELLQRTLHNHGLALGSRTPSMRLALQYVPTCNNEVVNRETSPCLT